MVKINILLIENNEEDAIQIAEMLHTITEFEADITHFLNLTESINYLNENEVSIILTNLTLPESYGLHTFNSLFEGFSHIPLLILTDLNDVEIGKNAVKHGAQDFLSKGNLTPTELSRTITYSIERKNTENDLRNSELKYRKLFLRSKDAIYLTTIEGNFIDVNPAGLDLFDYTKEDLRDLKVSDLYVNTKDREALKHKLAENGEVKDYELLLKKKDPSKTFHCLLNATVILNDQDNIIGYQGIIRDTTKQKENEQALVQSLKKLDQVNQELIHLNSTLEQKVNERTKQLLKEKQLVEISNKDIRESIAYAKRIQASILPPIQKIKEGFKNSFVYYEPKDVVSGDFYWYESNQKSPVFAVVDCTGHGVPGAFMSIIGYTQLNEIIKQQAVAEPGEILKELDKRVKSALNQNKVGGINNKDGMELGLLTVNQKTNTLEYAGAMRPLYMVRDGHLQIFKGDKHSIGGASLREKKFTTQHIKIQKGDSFYLFTDGYPDQFGGPRGKKFMSRNVGDMLRGVAHLPSTEQMKVIKQSIKDWMGSEEQVDDILFSGITF